MKGTDLAQYRRRRVSLRHEDVPAKSQWKYVVSKAEEEGTRADETRGNYCIDVQVIEQNKSKVIENK